jgi:hypothetical protein
MVEQGQMQLFVKIFPAVGVVMLCKGRTPGQTVRLLTFWAKATFIPENDALHFENNIYVYFRYNAGETVVC